MVTKPGDRFQSARRKLSCYIEEFKVLDDGGIWYFMGFGTLLILLIPFLVFDLAILLLTGKDFGWFPATNLEQVQIANTGQGPKNADEAMSLLEPLRTSAIHAVQTSASDVFSKFGGLPDMPEGFTWPRWKSIPLAFLAQIKLSDLDNHPALKELPRSGLLYFFYTHDQSTWGFDPADRGSWHIQYFPENRELAVFPAPADLPADAIFKEKRVEFRTISIYPTIDRLQADLRDLPIEAWDEIQARRAAVFKGEPHHQIGGLPDAVQNDAMELDCQLAAHGVYCGDGSAYQDPSMVELKRGSGQWRLLLQIDTDDDINMMWGDSGMLYFWINITDLKRQDFSNTWMILQCC